MLNKKLLGTLLKMDPREVISIAAVADGKKPVTNFHFEYDELEPLLNLYRELKLCWAQAHEKFVYRIGMDRDVLKKRKKQFPSYTPKLYGYNLLERDIPKSKIYELYERGLKISMEEKPIRQLLIPMIAKNVGERMLEDYILLSGFDFNFYVSKDPRAVFLLWMAYQISGAEHAGYSTGLKAEGEIGSAFGFPECCINAYIEGNSLLKYKEKTVDAKMEKSEKVELRAVNYVPCGPKCENSIKLGREYLNAVKKLHPKLYSYVLERITYPAIHLGMGISVNISKSQVKKSKLNEKEFLDLASSYCNPQEYFLADTNKYRFVPSRPIKPKFFEAMFGEEGVPVWVGVELGKCAIFCCSSNGEIEVFSQKDAGMESKSNFRIFEVEKSIVA